MIHPFQRGGSVAAGAPRIHVWGWHPEEAESVPLADKGPPGMSGGDEQIVDLLAAGDPRAMEMLYDRYGRLAYALAYRVVNDAGAAEDVVQESFLSVWRQSHRFDAGRGGLRTWVCAIVHHRAVDRLRGRQSRSRLDVSFDSAPALSVPDGWQQVADGLTRDAVLDALEKLPREQRETVELAYYGGLSQTEISQRMDAPLGTVKGRMRLALRRLHQLLAGQVVEGTV